MLINDYIEWIYLDKIDDIVFILCKKNPPHHIRINIIKTMIELKPYLTYKIVWRSYQRCMTSAFQLTGPLIKKFLLGQIETIYYIDSIVEYFSQYIDVIGHSTIWKHILLHDMMYQFDNTWKYVIVLLYIIMDKPYRHLLEDLYILNVTDSWLLDDSIIIYDIIDELKKIENPDIENMIHLFELNIQHNGQKLYQSVQIIMNILNIYNDNETIQNLINYNYWKTQLHIL